jgi:uncharacterized protein
MKPLRLFLALLCLSLAAGTARAESLGDIRARMEKRVSQVDQLKKAGVLGEDNRGFLDVRAGNDQGVVAAENADRAVVYAAIAQKTGTTADEVGRARAKQIATASAAGVWVQAENGQWAKK